MSTGENASRVWATHDARSQAFYEAAADGDLAKLGTALGSCLNINALKRIQGDSGHTALHIAAENGHVQIIRFLLAHGADLNAWTHPYQDPMMLTALHLAILNAHVEAVRCLLDAGADITTNYLDDGSSGPPLQLVLLHPYLACRPVERRHFDTINLLLDRGADINGCSSFFGQGTLIQQAAHADCPELVAHLITRGASFNHFLEDEIMIGPNSDSAVTRYLHSIGVGDDDSRALWFTAWDRTEMIDVAKFLLSQNPNLNSEGAKSTLCIAALMGHLNLVHLFLDDGMDVNGISFGGKTPLLAACGGSIMSGINRAVVQALLERGADINARTVSNPDYARILGNTPLHESARLGDADVVKLLLNAGADVHLRNSRNETALICFARRIRDVTTRQPAGLNSRIMTLKLLLDAGSDVNAADGSNMTALHWLARAHAKPETKLETAQMLISHGIDQTVRGRSGNTASDLFKEIAAGDPRIPASRGLGAT